MKAKHLLSTSQWNDLVTYKPWETIKELLLPLPWFFLAIWANSNHWYFLALIASA